MKLAILHSGDLETVSPGGMDQYVKNLITGLSGFEVTLFGVSHGGEFEIGKFVQRSFDGAQYGFVPLIDDSKYPLCPRFMKALKRNLASFSKFDCVFAQRIEYTLPFAFSSLRNRLVQIVHGSSANAITHMSPLRARAYLLAERASVAISRKTVVILKRDESGLPYYRRRYPKYRDRIVYNHIPVDLASFNRKDKRAAKAALGIDGDEFVVAYCGRVEDMPKRVLMYPDISKMLQFPHRFLIVGDGSSLPVLKERCEEMGVVKHFLFTGFVEERGRLAEKISAADVTVNVSTDEGTCTSVLESLACGVPVVSTDAGDIREVVFNGNNGIIIPNGSDRLAIVQQASEAITRIYKKGCPMTDAYVAYSKAYAIHEVGGLLCEVAGVGR